VASAARGRRSAGDRAPEPWLDLQFALVDEKSGELLKADDGSWRAIFGGRWSREHRVFDETGDADTSRVVRLHPGQLDGAYWFCEWLHGYITGTTQSEDKVYDALFAGGRRGGKSALMFTLGVCFALACPGSTVCIVTPSDAFYAEPIKYLEAIMPKEWYVSLGAPHWTYYLANGSAIVIRSGQTAHRQKQGQVDLYLINEGQAVPTQSYTTLSAGIVDTGGLIITAANPPDVGDKGDWVTDLAVGADRGDLVHARYFFFDPELNPHIDQTALRALAAKMDPHTYNVQVRGMFLMRPDTVLHTWSRKENERPMPTLGECTADFVKHFEQHSGRTDIIGVDPQKYPWVAGLRFRAFRNPLSPKMDDAFLWGCGESFIDKGDEIDCARGFRLAGVDPRTTMTVMDASGDWQQGERAEEKQRPEYKGMGSMDMFRGEGFIDIVPPDPYMKGNPDLRDRVRAANARIGSAAGQRYVFLDPKLCPRMCESIKYWKTMPNGMPSRSSKHAHGGDAMTYVIWRFFPRRSEKTSVDVETLKRFATTRPKGFT